MNDFCSQKGIKREFSNDRTPKQNGVAERRNRTLIEAARTMLLVNKSQSKTPYELFNGVVQFEEKLKEYKEREETYIVKIRTLEMYRASDLESIKILTNEVETLKEGKDVVDRKLARLLKSSKYLENIIESQMSDKDKEGVGYNVVPPPAADLYLSPCD
nr:putative ribonuclease H-like domain-containing protein [Tanacetum cinerariifolium]